MLSILLVQLVLQSIAVLAAPQSAFITCFDGTKTLSRFNFPTTTATRVACQEYCLTQYTEAITARALWTAFRKSDGSCLCRPAQFDTLQGSNEYIPASGWIDGTDSRGTCKDIDYTFEWVGGGADYPIYPPFVGCFAEQLPGSTVSRIALTGIVHGDYYSRTFRMNQGLTTWAWFATSGGSGLGNYYTHNISLASLTPATCGPLATTYWGFQPTSPAQGSRKKRREATERRLCPLGSEACRTADQKGHDCIEVEQDLTSCGGCLYGRFIGPRSAPGVNCLDIPGVHPNGVECSQGGCKVYKCEMGYILRDGQCIAKSK